MKTDVFGEKLDENTKLDLTNYKMMSKYGNSESLNDKRYRNIFKGGNSKDDLKKLNDCLKNLILILMEKNLSLLI